MNGGFMSKTKPYTFMGGPRDGDVKRIGWASPEGPGVVFVVVGSSVMSGIRHRYVVDGDCLIHVGAERFMEVSDAGV